MPKLTRPKPGAHSHPDKTLTIFRNGHGYYAVVDANGRILNDGCQLLDALQTIVDVFDWPETVGSLNQAAGRNDELPPRLCTQCNAVPATICSDCLTEYTGGLQWVRRKEAI